MYTSVCEDTHTHTHTHADFLSFINPSRVFSFLLSSPGGASPRVKRKTERKRESRVTNISRHHSTFLFVKSQWGINAKVMYVCYSLSFIEQNNDNNRPTAKLSY